jgi:hypothetical protein
MSNGLVKANQGNSNDIVIDDGSRIYNIKNKRGEVMGRFKFVPSDMGIVERYEHTIAVFEGLQAKLSNEKEDADIKQIKVEAEAEIKKEVDYLFKANVSGSFFEITSPFTPLESGEFFVESVINAVRAVIEKETGKRLGKAKSRASKYTQKYHK